MSSPNDKISLFENMASADPENELAHFSLGKLYVDAGRFGEAESSLRRTLELNAQHTQAHHFLGQALLALGRRDDAIRILEDGVKLGHVRGEYMPRNHMISLLEKEGVEPPQLFEDEDDDGTGDADDGTFRCQRCLRSTQELDDAPFSSKLGKQIQTSICQDCWKEWMEMSVKVINEYRLNPATPEGAKIYDEHMTEFLGLQETQEDN